MKTNEELLLLYADAWNNLDASIIAPYLTEDFEYGSMFVLTTIIGRDKYIDYLQKKFETIKCSGSKVFAKVGPAPSSRVHETEQTLLLLQDRRNGCHFSFHYKEGKISFAYLMNLLPDSAYQEIFRDEIKTKQTKA